MFALFAGFDFNSLWPSSGQTLFFDGFSIAYIVILVLSLLIGAKKGLMKMFFSLFGLIICIAGAALLAKPVAALISNNTSLDETIVSSVYDWFLTKSPDVANVLTGSQAEAAIPALLTSLNIPAIFQPNITAIVLAAIPTVVASEAIGIYIAQVVAEYTMIAGSFIILFILFLIVIYILKNLFKKLAEHSFVKSVDRTVGAVLGLVIGLVIVTVVSYGLTFATSIGSLNDAITTTLKLTDSTKWSFAKMVYEQNIIALLLGMI